MTTLENNIQEKLDRMGNLQAKEDIINMDFNELRDSLLTPELRVQLRELEEERQTALESLQAGMTKLREEIAKDVLRFGDSVKGKYLHAVRNNGKVTWDSKKLEGYAEAHPEVRAFRKQGAPSVTFRKVK
jgi:hypothetical protein